MVPGQTQQTGGAEGKRHCGSSGIVNHVQHHEHVQKEDRDRFDKSNRQALHYAVEARKLDDTDEAIVKRAETFRAFLISTSGS